MSKRTAPLSAIFVLPLLGFLLLPMVSAATETAILKALFIKIGGSWRVDVTLRHPDTGWDHYANAWRVVDEKGALLGERILFHPHVDEQPFTRSQSGIVIPDEVKVVYVEARDTVHGWSKDRIRIDLSRAAGDRYLLKR